MPISPAPLYLSAALDFPTVTPPHLHLQALQGHLFHVTVYRHATTTHRHTAIRIVEYGVGGAVCDYGGGVCGHPR